MDATRRAELDDLRRRVFGPDGTDDPEALERLRVLEDELHREMRSSATGPVADAPVPPIAPSARSRPPAPKRAPEPDVPGWRRTVPTAIGAVLIAVIALALTGVFGRPPAITTRTVTASDAHALVADADAVILQRIVVLSGFEAMPMPDGDRVPAFPTDGALQWAVIVAHSHGWSVWIAGSSTARGIEHCLAAAAKDEAWARCVLAEDQDGEVLAVTVPSETAGHGAHLLPGQQLGFWWSAAERAIFVVRATATAE